MKKSDLFFNVVVGIFVILLIVSVYGQIFGKAEGYTFTEFGYTCVVVNEGSNSAMWCEKVERSHQHNTIGAEHESKTDNSRKRVPDGCIHGSSRQRCAGSCGEIRWGMAPERLGVG